MTDNSERLIKLLFAMHDVAHHYRPVSLSVQGTHDMHTVIQTGDYEFTVDDDDERDRFIAWAHAVRSRPANTPVPEPPKESDGR